MKQLFTMMALAALLAACSKDGDSAAGPKQIAIDPTIANPAVMPAAQRATRATDTDFEQGDAVGLTVRLTLSGEEYAANKQMTYDAVTKTFSAADFIWYEDENQPATLFAYYPWQEGAAAPAEFTVQADQSGEGYAQSDLIAAVKTNVYPTKSATAMTFRHKMTRILIAVTNESGHAVTGIVIKGAVATGVLDAQTGDFAAKAGAEPSDVKAHTATADKLYYALLVPQKGVQLKVEVTTDDGRVRSLTLGTTDLRSGENRRMPMNVQEKDITVTFGGPITGWEDGEQLLPDGGTPTEATLDYGGVTYKIVTLKDGRTWMAENLRYVPEGKSVSSVPGDGSGIWFPCNLEKAADESLVETNGLLYSYPVLLGMTGEFTADNYNTSEGVRGICPEGWHVPTQAEWLALTSVEEYGDAADKVASIVKLNAAGFNIGGCGYINATNAVATPAYMANKSAADATAYGMGYYASSTAYKLTFNTADDVTSGIKNIQYYAGMVTYNAANNTLKTVFQGAYGAAPVRCIKDAQ